MMPMTPSSNKPLRSGRGGGGAGGLLVGILLLSAASAALFNYSVLRGLAPTGPVSSLASDAPLLDLEAAVQAYRASRPVASYWWPAASDGGLIGKIHAVQNPSDCAKPSSRFLVWRSMRRNQQDTRGLTAWAHAGSSHLLHALTDGEGFDQFGSRILTTDRELWPMAKGCPDGPETRDCYFEPLTNCTLSDAAAEGSTSVQLVKNGDEYDRSARTVYTSPDDIWFRVVRRKYSWTGLPGGDGDHSAMAMVAAALAYYLRPNAGMRKEIDRRIQRSIPTDLNPARTIESTLHSVAVSFQYWMEYLLNNFDPRLHENDPSIGVPIRRSDKCIGHGVKGSAPGELDCPPLDKYMGGVRDFLNFDPLIENVIVTSEEKAACEEFVRLLHAEYPRLRVVLNVGDIQQGTGSGNKLESYEEGSANRDVVASALTSMHLHLRARYFVITSKSTWTSTIAVMARSYGFASQVFVIDIGRNSNDYSSYARKGS
ncbi:hypothetical protein ACHAWF_003945 [Thalassiosira exigua]